MADTATIEARAQARHLRVSPPKVRQVLTLIRGLPVEDAERVLQLCERSAADDVFKLLESAIANAGNVHQLEPEELFVAHAFADEGPTRKWGRPRARGRYARIHKRSSHVTIVVARMDTEELEARRERDEARGGASAEARRRRADRVARSRAAAAAADHDHDHEHGDDDHDHGDEETVDAGVDSDDSSDDAPEASSDAPDDPADESDESDEAR